MGAEVGVNQWRRGEEETSEVEEKIENHEVESRRIGSRKRSRESSRDRYGSAQRLQVEHSSNTVMQ